MNEETATPYPERTEEYSLLVCEPATEYGKPIGYQGTTITNALKDYYAFTTNREKVDVLKWIVVQPDFTESQRFSTAENKIYTLYTNQYDEILKTGEIPNNLQIAQKFVANGYDVFLLSNPKATKSADFIIRRRNCLYYVEGKTSSGGSSIEHRFEKGAEQANAIALQFTDTMSLYRLSSAIKTAFERNESLRCLFLFKGKKLIFIKQTDATSKKFYQTFLRLWK
ncbi:MAG: hypothetical protein J5588_07350 [Bacteroidales bacterium]|nr:hypothetical protein [Bacteroidales bacterium]